MPDDTIVFSSYPDGLVSVYAQGGPSVSVLAPDPELDRRALKFPQMLPDGDSILYSEGGYDISSYDEARVGIVSRATGRAHILFEGGSYARYSPTGHILFSRGGSLVAVVFDPDKLEVSGAPLPAVERIVSSASYGAAQFDISDDGTLIYVTGEQTDRSSRLVWIDRGGRVEAVPLEPRSFLQPRLSPDGRTIAFREDGANTHLWLYDLGRRSVSRLTYEGSNEDPVWSPDGEWVAFSSSRRGGAGSYRKAIDSQEAAEELVHDLMDVQSWSPDGRLLSLTSESDIALLSIDDGKVELLLQSRFQEEHVMFSPDGEWVAYESNASGRFEVYLRRVSESGEAHQVSTDGGRFPRWDPAGGELFYRSGEQWNRWMVVEVDLAPKLVVEHPGGSSRLPMAVPVPSASTMSNVVGRDS